MQYSEREWHALRAEFEARIKLFISAYHLCSGGLLTDPEGDCNGPGKEYRNKKVKTKEFRDKNILESLSGRVDLKGDCDGPGKEPKKQLLT